MGASAISLIWDFKELGLLWRSVRTFERGFPAPQCDYSMTFRRRDRLVRASLALVVVGCTGSLACNAERQRDRDAPAVEERRPARPMPAPAEPLGSSTRDPQPTARSDAADAPAALGSGGGMHRPSALGKIRFVAIGDYGWSGPAEERTAELVNAFQPDFVITTGDNNYPYGEAATIDENIGRYFHAFIAPYRGRFGEGAEENRFFPSLGNHDWASLGAQPYLDYFSLPNNERYYQIVRGNVQLFALDSDVQEPDGTTVDSKQAHWLEALLGAATVPWRVVFFHHPPYSSSNVHGSSPGMRWPFAEWGASIVYSGHDHTYERLDVDGFPYIVNGVGGKELYGIGEPLPQSLVTHSDVHGLVLVTATATEFVSRFLDERGQELDVFRLSKE
jgi:tartrate-resistant acid phosphatase type 5